MSRIYILGRNDGSLSLAANIDHLHTSRTGYTLCVKEQKGNNGQPSTDHVEEACKVCLLLSNTYLPPTSHQISDTSIFCTLLCTATLNKAKNL